jgi:L-histidine Nalpha-methyltransferase / hercynylcysteine S-oxide synthase
MTIPSASKISDNFALAGKTIHTVKPLKSQADTSEGTSNIDIIDIRHDAVEINLKEETLSSLRPQSGPKTMPTLLLYDEQGLQLFEEVSGHL